jgi:hypothetical protein
MKKILTSVMLAAFLSLMQGCATAPTPMAGPDKSGEQLDRIIGQGLPKRTSSADMGAHAAKLNGAISINDYAGEAKSLLRKLAIAQNLRFAVRGPQPHMPLFVMVNVRNATIEEVLQDIGSQFGQRANVILTSTAIEVHYRDQ